MLVKHFGCRHLSAGDLLREEQQRPDSDVRDLIHTYIKEGLIVPAEITVGLLKREISNDSKAPFFLVDGFPRAVEQWETFNAIVHPTHVALLFLTTTDDILVSRCLSRGTTSGRVDDNEESVRKRLAVFHRDTVEVHKYFDGRGLAKDVDGSKAPDEVFAKVRGVVEELQRLILKKE
eukprot:gnl/Chilomastix_caulleri/2275.p1 GENE.gnl/Chilomastix_caulleri/2275~~gnl/Chilomastix_caulleri/2275.p1  ORF type:complete len:177 (-),score=31.98 gnl/Chilomastix_caulleri/2275:139-669(-)